MEAFIRQIKGVESTQQQLQPDDRCWGFRQIGRYRFGKQCNCRTGYLRVGLRRTGRLRSGTL